MRNTFFMVYVQGERNPTYKHNDLVFAETEAKRLAKLTGKEATVLCSIKTFKLNEFEVTDNRPENDDLPF